MTTQPVSLLNRSTGLNVVVDPVRLQYDPERGNQELAAAFNVDIDQTGRVSRRRGYELLNPTPCHSVWCGAGRRLCVAGGYICLITDAWVFEQLVQVSDPDARVWFLDVNGDVFWSNGLDKGILRSGITPTAWDVLPYTQENDARVLSAMPAGKHLELFNGRIYLTNDKVLFFSEPLGYHWFDNARNWVPFSGTITMVQAVHDGLYIGTSIGAYFLGGAIVQEMSLISVSASPVIEGTDSKIDGRMVLEGEMPTQAVMWTSLNGIYAGFSGGKVHNLTKDKLRYPGGNTGSAVVNNDVYLSLIDP